ncbi:cupin domain-containing protein [Collimonas sp.]|jgi:quercetin dioxygenase-like cupin family protein|uniref:cupin domain-containing protein n=1 Tax=Collimonas sp. TaxID=1963772 RepID=UPI002CAF5778|nr:cupin domain-containing protein [Collimonas sp.]HWX02889.1 cupin domain-containing protein [Collimonas sp.]
MLSFSKVRLAVAAAAVVITCAAAGARAETAPDPAAGITRTMLQRYAIPGSDQEMRMDLIVFPPGAASPLHHHPVAGLNYILEGTAESAYGDEQPRLYHAGESLQDRATVPHTLFRNADQHAVLRFLIFYTVKVGQPYLVVP